MIQDIWPKHLDNQYKNLKPGNGDTVFYFQGSSLLARPSGHFNSQNPEENVLIYPQYSEFVQGIKSSYGDKAVDNFEFIYLLSIDEEHFFLARKTGSLERGTFLGEMADSAVHKDMYSFVRGYEFIGVDSFRKAQPREHAYAAITAFHLYGWYRDNHFCGRCGKPLRHDDKQRMLRCDCCKNMVFPKICPAVIVAVTDKDRILLTKYAGRTYRNYALIAGFTEIGETTEETVSREVMEEVGVKVKNITLGTQRFSASWLLL